MEHLALAEASVRHPFGPAFFMTQSRGFAGDRCPDPALERPVVEIHLGDGETLDLRHIIGVTPGWVALAVLDGDGDTSPRPPPANASWRRSLRCGSRSLLDV